MRVISVGSRVLGRRLISGIAGESRRQVEQIGQAFDEIEVDQVVSTPAHVVMQYQDPDGWNLVEPELESDAVD